MKRYLKVLVILTVLCPSFAAADNSTVFFPPSNVPACNGAMGYLGWDGSSSTTCVTPQMLLSDTLNCTPNQFMVYDGSKYRCKDIPVCTGQGFLQFNGTSLVCAPLALPSCAEGQYLTHIGNDFRCLDFPPDPKKS
jgi:hypothetical protein